MRLNNLLKDINIDNDYVVVGVSTGCDSMALFHYLINNTSQKIICAHINHNVRKESNEEEEYLRNYCLENNIIFETIKLTNYQENNFENEARKKRYAFYEKLLKKYNTKYLFLAHHGDDLIETILMKIARGSNIEGYAGLKKINKVKDYYIIRPLLEYTKKDILEYCQNHKITYFDDISNTNTQYTRNRYRQNILPLLKKEDEQIHKKFLKYSKTLLEYQEYVEKTANDFLKKVYNKNTLDLIKFKNIDPFIQKNILYILLNDIYNNQSNITKEKHIENILKIINSNKPNLQINLPHNIVVIKSYNSLKFKKDIQTKSYIIPLKSYNEIGNIILKIEKFENSDGNDICRLNKKNIKLPLYIRNRKNGDYIILKGLNQKKKISDIFIEKKIPKEKRNNYPLLVDDNDNILWIPNIKKSKFNSSKNEMYDIIIKYCEKEENDEK